MSTSFVAEKARTGLDLSLNNIKFKKHRNQNNNTSLSELSKHFMGFQKMGMYTSYRWPRPQDRIFTEKMNNPNVSIDWGSDFQGSDKNPDDPFGEMMSSGMRGYSNTWVGMYANMFGVRRNANAVEQVKLRCQWKRLLGGIGRQSAIVFVTYDSITTGGNQTVVKSQPWTSAGVVEMDVTIPADGNTCFQVSIQHTLEPQTIAKDFGLGIFDWSLEYV